MTFKFECPYCGQRISATEGQVATTGVCPACQRDVDVPSGPALEPTPVEAPKAEAPAPVLASEPPPPQPAVPPPVAPQQRPPVRPVQRAAPPVPIARPSPLYTPPAWEDPGQDVTSPPGWPIFALLLCIIPIPGLILLRIFGLGDVAPFGMLLAGSAAVCFLGIILAHRAWWRSKRRLSARLFALLGLLLGYSSALVLGSMAMVLDTSGPVVLKRNDAPPDLKPKGVELAKLEPPDLKPKQSELPPIPPPEKPDGGEPAKPAPAAPPPAMASAAGDADPAQFFEGKIHPILVDKCFKCHSEEGGKHKGGLTLDTREAALKGGETGPGFTPGDPGASLLIKAVLYTDDNLQMPPKGEKLSDREIADLTAWVKMGAPYAAKAK